VIRRGFWLAAGAVTGIYGYRRVSALGRRLSATLNPAEPGAALTQSARLAQQARLAQGAGLAQGARLARRGSRGAIGLTRETYRFTRDVREGMDLYMARHHAAAGSTLSADRSADHEPADRSADHEPADHEPMDHESTDHESTDHEPEDGH